jgi:hypothetical protein
MYTYIQCIERLRLYTVYAFGFYTNMYVAEKLAPSRGLSGQTRLSWGKYLYRGKMEYTSMSPLTPKISENMMFTFCKEGGNCQSVLLYVHTKYRLVLHRLYLLQ